MPRHFARCLLMTAALSACAKDSPPAPTTAPPAADTAATPPTPAPPTADTAASSPDSAAATANAPTWQAMTGAVTLPGGIALRLLVKRTPDGLTLDIPDQNLAGAPLSDLTETADTLSFAFQPRGAPPAARGVFSATRAADGTYRGHLEQGGQKFPLELTENATGALAARLRPQTPKPPFPYPTHELKVAVDGGELACTLALPATASKDRPAPALPALILRTGSGAQDRDETLFEHKPFLLLADAFARAGVATLRCDDRGAGQSVAARREDDLGVFLADAKATFAALASRAEIDPTRVGVLGHSEGAMTAAELIGGATEGPPIDTPKGPVRPAFAVLLAGPGRSGREILVHQNRDLVLGQGGTREHADQLAAAADALFRAFEADPETLAAAAAGLADATLAAAGPNPPEPREKLIARFQALANEPWMRSFVKNDPRPHLARATVPVLALFGAKDTQVPPSDAEALRQAASDKVEIDVMPGVNHLFQPAQTGTASEYALIETTMDPAVLDRVVGWVTRVVGRDGATSD